MAEARRSIVHLLHEPCPEWCHFCPHLDGGVFPYCWGSTVHADNERDIMHCHCVPGDPIVAHIDLVSRTNVLQMLLREKRRTRQLDRTALTRLRDLSSLMRGSMSMMGHRTAWEEVHEIALRLCERTPPAVHP